MKTEIKRSDLMKSLQQYSDEEFMVFDTKTGGTHMIGEGKVDDEAVPDEEINERLIMGQYLEMPSSHNVHEYEYMMAFIYSLTDAALQEELFNVIGQPGAFQNFRKVVEDHGETEHWEHFRDASVEQVGVEWARKYGIRIVKD